MIKKRITESKKDVPWQVKTIAILNYIGAGFSAILGLLLIFGANGIVTSLISTSPELAGILTSGIIILFGIIILAFGVLAFFIGRGLWRLKLWAKIVTIIFAIGGFLLAIVSVFTAFRWSLIINLIVYGFIGGYLIFDKESRRIFK